MPSSCIQISSRSNPQVMNCAFLSQLAIIVTTNPFDHSFKKNTRQSSIYRTQLLSASMLLQEYTCTPLGAGWEGVVKRVKAKACTELGVVPAAATTSLPHRDTEKEDRMFATLVIVLPSIYEVLSLLMP